MRVLVPAVRDLTGCPDPRQDTETLVEQALLLPVPDDARVLDLGTGTGAVALALGSERYGWDITGSDASPAAVALASRNRDALGLPGVTFVESDWFRGLEPGPWDLIVSNPPYVAEGDEHLEQGDLRFEPHAALVAGNDGMEAIRRIVREGHRSTSIHGAGCCLSTAMNRGRPSSIFWARRVSGTSSAAATLPATSGSPADAGRVTANHEHTERRRPPTLQSPDPDARIRHRRPEALAKGRVLVVGAGGLGCPIVLYLAAAGVGHIHVIDDDRVELANLQRQIAFTMDDLDKPKASPSPTAPGP